MELIKKIIKRIFRLVRVRSDINLFWTGKEDVCPNFGDMIGPYLYTKITGRQPRLKKPSNFSITTTFLTVGSILSWCREDSVVWGSGIVFRDQTFPNPHSVHAVRGPLTRERFLKQGYSCPSVYGDPALLLPLFFSPEGSSNYILGVVPHYVDKSQCELFIKASDDIQIIDVFNEVEVVVENILKCDYVISSSLHGLIIAHAYGIKAHWVKFSDKLWGDDVKFLDHFRSLGLVGDLQCDVISKEMELDELLELFGDSFQPSKDVVKSIQVGLIESCPFSSKS